VLTCRGGKIKSERYWEISFLKPSTDKEPVLARKLKNHFTDAVASCLDFDGNTDKIGTFLSGGIDSSTLTGIIGQLDRRPVKTFSMGFYEKGFNETYYAKIAANKFQSEYHEYFVSPRDTYDALPVLIDSFDEPYGNASAVPTYFCAKMAKASNVDILYGGDGGDELFAGNERYAQQKIFEYYNLIPNWFAESVLKPAVFNLSEKIPWKYLTKAKKYILRASIPYGQRITSYDFFNVVPLSHLLTNDLLQLVGENYNPYAPFVDYYTHAPARYDLDRHLYLDWHLTISDNDLFKFRMAEAAGVAIRFPFLDHRLAEFSVSVPAKIKMRGTRLRSFFKRAYADLLPIETRNKKKHGFALPFSFWLKEDKLLNEVMHDLLLSPRSIQRGYYRKSTLEELIQLHQFDNSDFYGTFLWHLMMVELWLRKYSDRAI
jgi:asparagine synthase (glutamine-hydrolysing)